jgi:hypothetical protein
VGRCVRRQVCVAGRDGGGGFDGRGGDRGSTVAAVKILVTRLLSDGYRFTTVDRMLSIPAYLFS